MDFNVNIKNKVENLNDCEYKIKRVVQRVTNVNIKTSFGFIPAYFTSFLLNTRKLNK